MTKNNFIITKFLGPIFLLLKMKNVIPLDVLNVVAVLYGMVGFVGPVDICLLHLTKAALRIFDMC